MARKIVTLTIEAHGRYYTKATAAERIEALEDECSRLRTELVSSPDITVPDSTEPTAVEGRVLDTEFIRIYIVWGVGTYANGVRLLDLRAVTTSMGKAKLYSRMLRANKTLERDRFDRVIIEQRVANHLYGEYLREWDLNVGLL